MKAVILVGGEGTRLRPLTCNIPKPMVPVLNRPFLEHMLSHLNGHGVDSVVLAMRYLPDKIVSHFGSGEHAGVALSYVLEDTPLGTAGAVKNVEEYLDGTFLVLNGDIYTDLDLSAMVRFHREKEAQVTLFLTTVDDPTAFGVVETDSSGRVLSFLEKPSRGETTSNWINGGIYIIERQVLTHIPETEFYMFERGLFPKLLDMGISVYGYQSCPYWVDMGTPASYVRVHQDLLTSNSQSHLIEDMRLGRNTSYIHPSARITGSVLLGEGCSIGAGALVQGPSVLGSGSVVTQEAVITASIIWKNVVVGRGAVLRGCVVGNRVQIGEGSRVDEGCIVGDDVCLGRANHVSRGMILWPEKSIEPEAISFD